MDGWSVKELMVVALARELRDGDLAMTGATSDVPVAACLLAQQLHAPNLTLILPSGVVNPRPGRLYRSASDGRWIDGAEAVGSGYDLFELSENGRLDVMFYGGVQIDRFGNINLTRVGDFRGPGLANISFAVVAKRICLYSMSHTRRTFVKDVDYLTAPGHLEGGISRRQAGITTEGPVFCITPLACMGFTPDTKELTVRSVHPGVTASTVETQTGFDLPEPPPWPETPPPTDEELTALREVVDRTGVLRDRT
ncbi:MAG TPA: CoA-transferase [Chloroflexota bacterium]|nr:CoA-transferase [Chloroflexota bacterium]